MRSFITCICFSILLFVSCNNADKAANLEQAFIQSFKDEDFKSLEPYLPTREVYKSLATTTVTKTDAEIDSFLAASNQRLKDSWDKIAATVKSKNIEPAKINIREKVLFNVFAKNTAQAMVVLYEYEGKTWDDLSFIVKEKDKITYLLEIPNPTSMFSFKDTSLNNISHAKATLELQQPAFQQSIQKHVKQMIAWAKENKIREFSDFVVYGGDDKTRSWNSAVNMADPVESKMAAGRLEEVKGAIMTCENYSFGNVRGENESEGFWIVQPVICGNKIVHFAFLKVKDKLLLGGVDTEIREE